MKSMKALGAYIFAGGFTLGVRKHFDVMAHFEDGPFGVATTQANIKRGKAPLSVFIEPDAWPISDYAGQVDYLYANPPCAPWSNAGSRVDRIPWQKNPLTACWRKTAELVWKVRPKVAHIESVRPLYTKGREMLDEIIAQGKKEGYQAIAILENALDCNMAQRRPRFVLCLTRLDYQPTPTHGQDVTPLDVLMDYYGKVVPDLNNRKAIQATGGTHQKETLKHTKPGEPLMDGYNRALRDKYKGKGAPSVMAKRIHPLKPSGTQLGSPMLFTMGNLRYAAPDIAKTIEGKVLKHAKPGERLSRVFGDLYPKAKPVDGVMKGRPSMLKYRIHPDKPSATQPGGAVMFHHKEDRYLTIGEAAALCSYPHDFEFIGSISSAYAQMGKAVMPNVGEHLAHDAHRTIKAGKKLKNLEPLEVTIGREAVTVRPMPKDGYKAPIGQGPKRIPRQKEVLPTKVPGRTGIGRYMRDMLRKGTPNDIVLDMARKKFPQSRCTMADVSWNVQHLKEGGKFHGEV